MQSKSQKSKSHINFQTISYGEINLEPIKFNLLKKGFKPRNCTRTYKPRITKQAFSNMLKCSGIIHHVHWSMNQVSRWNFTKFQFPVTLQGFHLSTRNANETAEHDQTVHFQFESNLGTSASYWFYHVSIIVTGIACIFYQIVFEDQLLEAIAIHWFEVVAYISVITMIYQQNSIAYNTFLNQLLLLEKTEASFQDYDLERKFWRKHDLCKLIARSIRLFTFLITTFEFVFPASVALFPYSPWKYLPTKLLDGFSILNFGGVRGILLTEVCTRVFSFVFTYVSLYLGISRFLILLVLSIIMGQGSLILMLLAFKRHLTSSNCRISSTDKLTSSVLFYREIQLVCCIYNKIHKMLVVPALILTYGFGCTVGLYMLMSTFVEKKLQTLIVFCNLLVMSISAIMLAFQFAAKFYMKSKRLLMSQSRRKHDEISIYMLNRRDCVAMKRYYRSFHILKIYFFQDNFFEENTSLVLLDFSINNAINLVLCGK